MSEPKTFSVRVGLSQRTVEIGVENFARRLVEDCVTEALAVTWARRAGQYEDARPRPGDFPGQATSDELAQRDERLTATAVACRSHAALLLGVFDD